MQQPERKTYRSMTSEERARFEKTVAEETAAKDANMAAARRLVPKVRERCDEGVVIVAHLKAAREAAGVSLSELEARTGILKSALSRLENSKAPNPTLSYLQRYAEAIGCRLMLAVEPK